jgi:hypothetical protein
LDFCTFIERRLPTGLSYGDAANLCMAMYCFDRVIPHEVAEIWNERAITDAFAALAVRGMIHVVGAAADPPYPPEDPRHWSWVIQDRIERTVRADLDRVKRLLDAR